MIRAVNNVSNNPTTGSADSEGGIYRAPPTEHQRGEGGKEKMLQTQQLTPISVRSESSVGIINESKSLTKALKSSKKNKTKTNMIKD